MVTNKSRKVSLDMIASWILIKDYAIVWKTSLLEDRMGLVKCRTKIFCRLQRSRMLEERRKIKDKCKSTKVIFLIIFSWMYLLRLQEALLRRDWYDLVWGMLRMVSFWLYWFQRRIERRLVNSISLHEVFEEWGSGKGNLNFIEG